MLKPDTLGRGRNGTPGPELFEQLRTRRFTVEYKLRSVRQTVLGALILVGLFPADLDAQRTGQDEPQFRAGPRVSEIMEAQARQLIRDYYSYHVWYENPEARPIPSHRPDPLNGWSESCIGSTLEECFGGDPDCHAYGIGAGAASPTSATLIRACTDPDIPRIRAEVQSALDSLGRLAPASDWIVGQRVSFALKSGDADRAFEIAESCEAAPWWCHALRGYALHHQDPGSAGAVFDSAYTTAPLGTPAWAEPPIPNAGDRGLPCEWADLQYLIEDAALLSEYKHLPCGENHLFAKRFWWLADPMWSRPGNVRRDEHIARNVFAKLRDEILREWWIPTSNNYHGHVRTVSKPENVSFRGWNGDLGGHGTVIRVGVPNSWRGIPWTRVAAHGTVYSYRASGTSFIVGSQNAAPRPSASRGQIREGFVNGGYSFVPDAGRYFDPAASTHEEWAVTWNEGHERMITRETWYNLPDNQIAVLRRGERLLALAAARLPVVVSSFVGLEGALAMGRPADMRLDVAPSSIDPSGTVRADLELEQGDWVASIELIQHKEWIGRARYGVPAPGVDESGFGISAPVLVDERFERGGVQLRSALLPTTELTGYTSVGVYFEMYGLEAGETVQVRLTGIPLRLERSFFGRIADALGVSSHTPPLRIEWSEPVDGAVPGRTERLLNVDLRGLRRGEYELSLEVERASGAVAISSRRVSVAR